MRPDRPSVSANDVYNGLGDRLQETINGQMTAFTMDYNTGLTQTLSDGTNSYIYGNGRIAQVNTSTEYFLGDALGSVRQLTDESGAVTYASAYDPYGVTTQAYGASQTVYGYTGEYTSNDMVYLRARHYVPGMGRFLTRDTWGGNANSPMTYNRWNYVNGNAINFSDPSGLYSAMQIADSYGLTVTQLILALQTGRYNSKLYNKWGWINLLLDAHDGQSVEIGSTALFPPFLDTYPNAQVGLNNGKINIGGADLGRYTTEFLDNPLSPVIWWRDTRPSFYYLDSAKEYLDNTNDLPDFRTIQADALLLLPIIVPHVITVAIHQLFDVGGAVTIDAYGNIYATGFGAFAPGIGLGIGVSEGYINYNPANLVDAIMGRGYRASEKEIHDTLTRWCFNGGANITPASFQVSMCSGGSTAFLYGYTAGLIGDSVGASYTFEPIGKIPHLAWNYIREKPGASGSDVLSRISLDYLADPCP